MDVFLIQSIPESSILAMIRIVVHFDKVSFGSLTVVQNLKVQHNIRDFRKSLIKLSIPE